MYRIVYGGFWQETNTFSPLICKREYFEAGGIYFDEQITKAMYGLKTTAGGMLNYLMDAEDVELIPTAYYGAMSYGRVEQSVCDEFLSEINSRIIKSGKLDGIFLVLHGGMCLTEEDDGIGYILEKIRATAGNEIPIVVCSDLHANITPKVMKNVDIICGFHEYPHTDTYETGLRAAKIGMQWLRTGVRPAIAWAKIPAILQAEACSTKEGPLYELNQYATEMEQSGKIRDFSIYHMQPWLDCENAGASVVVMADDMEQAKKYADEFAARFFSLRRELQYKPLSVDEGLDFAIKRPTGEMIVLSDAADNTSGGAAGDSVVVLRRILERQLDIRAACVVVDPPAAEQAEKLGVGATAEFTVGGKLTPKLQKPVTFTGTVQKICNPIVTETSGNNKGKVVNFGRAVIVRVRNTDVILVTYPQLNYSPTQFTGFGLNPADYDMFLVKSSLAYKFNCSVLTSQLYNVDTQGSTTSNLRSLPFTRIPRPMYPFDDTDDFGPTPASAGRTD